MIDLRHLSQGGYSSLGESLECDIPTFVYDDYYKEIFDCECSKGNKVSDIETDFP